MRATLRNRGTEPKSGLALRFILLALVIVAALGIAACGGDSDGDATAEAPDTTTPEETVAADPPAIPETSAPSADKLRIGVQKDGIRPNFETNGLLDDAPYEVEWATFLAGPPIVEAASADKIDISWVGAAPPIFGAAADAGFRVVAAVQERDFKENSILVPADSDIKTVEDLAGKKVAVGKGTSAHGLLVNALTRSGLTPDDIESVFLAPPDGLAAFSGGDVDAWVVWDPFSTQAIQDLDAVEITGGEPDERAVGFLVASEAALADPARRELIIDYVGRFRDSTAWAVENPQLWAEAWSAESGLPIDVTSVVAVAKASDVIAVSDEIIAAQQALADLFFEVGELPVEVDFTSIIEPGIITD